jgi:hypothetical protein
MIALASLFASPMMAGTIDFEELPPANDSRMVLSEEYAEMGVHFVASDDGATWGGMGDGDPGLWKLEGTAGSAFLGFDGQSYVATLHFDTPVEGFSMDAARAAGARLYLYDMFQVTGFLDGQIVESDTIFFGGENSWRTLSLTGMVDKVVWFGTGFRGHRFGVDNLRWSDLEPQMLEVEIDIKPGSDVNPVNPDSRGVLPVVLYGSESFVVEDVAPETLAFGPEGAGIAHREPHRLDIDGDGLLDMLLHHRVAETGISSRDLEACLGGMTLDGTEFEGCDDITLVPRRNER